MSHERMFSALAESVNRHYGSVDLRSRILDKLKEAGKDLQNVTRDDLAPFDEFHTGGRTSTRELAGMAGVTAGMQVLDVGSGVGGPARTLAGEFGCIVTGVDLTEEFCFAAQLLTELVGLADRVSFHHGDALALPFPDGQYDLVWSQNTVMNIEDKARLFREIHRVLKPGGRLALETVLAGPTQGIHYPTFWAAAPEMNFLVSPGHLRGLLIGQGFAEETWEDITGLALAAARKRLAASGSGISSALGRDVIVTKDVMRKIENSVRNNTEGRTITIRGVFRWVDGPPGQR
jgi:MPBQ/MSBQ methyltransferase